MHAHSPVMLFRATIGFNTMKIIMLRRHPKDNNFFRYRRVGTSSDILSAQWNYSQVLLVSLPFQSPASQKLPEYYLPASEQRRHHATQPQHIYSEARVTTKAYCCSKFRAEGILRQP